MPSGSIHIPILVIAFNRTKLVESIGQIHYYQLMIQRQIYLSATGQVYLFKLARLKLGRKIVYAKLMKFLNQDFWEKWNPILDRDCAAAISSRQQQPNQIQSQSFLGRDVI